jgi:hypothetical protein
VTVVSAFAREEESAAAPPSDEWAKYTPINAEYYAGQ